MNRSAAPATAARSAPLTQLRCLWFGVAVAAGAALALLAAPALFSLVPTDLTRTRVILDALDRDESALAPVVLFGNSVGMASADMGRIGAMLPGKPLAWNLASTGQPPQESYLFYQKLKPTTRLIVQMLNPGSVVNLRTLDEQKYNAFYMYGYRPDQQTQEVMIRLLGLNMGEILARSGIEQRFASRWAFRQLADRTVRSALRPDLEIERATYDLLFPNSHTTSLPERIVRQQIAAQFNARPDIYRARANKMAFLGEMAARARAQGQQIVFVLAPIHPEEIRARGPQYVADARRAFADFAREHGVLVLDGIERVPAAEFADTLHPSPQGGATFSDWLGAELVQAIETGRLRY